MAITFDQVSASVQAPPTSVPPAATQPNTSTDDWRDDYLRLDDLERQRRVRRNRLSAD